MADEIQPSRSHRKWLAGTAVLVLVATWAVFHGAQRGAFLAWDDDINITGNSHIHGLTAENIRWMFTDTEYVRRYIPAGWLGWAVQYQLLGENAQFIHVYDRARIFLPEVSNGDWKDRGGDGDERCHADLA